MKKIIENILKTNEKTYIYFKSLHAAERFLNLAKENGFSVPEGGVTCAAVICGDKHIEYISYGNHEEFLSEKEKTIITE